MIIFLRTPDNKTLVDIEVFGGKNPDLSSVVIIGNYSRFLLEYCVLHVGNSISELIDLFDDLQELRGWLFEKYLAIENKNADQREIEEKVIEILKPIAEEYDLRIVTD
jgi:hypothetical protein